MLLGNSEDTWTRQVVEPASKVINSFLNSDVIPISGSEEKNNVVSQKLTDRDLWTRYICEVSFAIPHQYIKKLSRPCWFGLTKAELN